MTTFQKLQMEAALDAFLAKNETVWGEPMSDGTRLRRYEFILPDTLFFTYGYGVRPCTISENPDNSVSVLYGTIDDAYMSFTVYLTDSQSRVMVYDTLIDILHVEKDHAIPWHFRYVLEFGNNQQDTFEKAIGTWLESTLRSKVNFHFGFDYN